MSDHLQKAKAKGEQFKQDYLTSSCVNFVAVMYLLQITEAQLLILTFNKNLIALNYIGLQSSVNQLAYPLMQFIKSERTYIKGLEKLDKFFVSPWDLIMFLESGDYYLSGKRPIDVLKEGDLISVLEAAANYGEQRAV